MANYPNYGFQPQMQQGYGQMMQPQGYGYQPQQMQQQQPEQMLYCRMVTSPEEARGVPVDFSGRPMTFLDLPHGRIYVKVFDAGSGSAVFRAFGLLEDPKEETQSPAESFAPIGVVQELQETVKRLEEEIRTMKAGRRRTQEVTVNED